MLEYNDLDNDEKRKLRETLNVDRIGPYYLEDNHILLMNPKELFEYIYLYEIEKFKDAIVFIHSIINQDITQNDINKTVGQKIIEGHNGVTKISDKVYVYKEL